MKQKLFFILLFCSLVTGFARADDTAPYETITPQPTASGDKIEVIEFFWYGCPHCFALEPYMEKWLASKPDDVVFRRIPAILGNNWVHYARVYYAAEKLGVVDKINHPLFDAIHDQRIPLNDATQLGDFLTKQGVDKDKFFTAYSSEEIGNKIKNAYVLGQDYGLTGVPTIIINGKYRTSASEAGSNEKLIQLMDELIQKERAPASAATQQTDTPKPVATAPQPAPATVAVPEQPQPAGTQGRLQSMLMIAGLVVMIVAVIILVLKIIRRNPTK